jgi:eukaryotic-like serine/threonine-protein kinase
VGYHTPGRVHEVFGAVLEQPPHLREQFLRQVCAGDAELENEVADLLHVHARLEGGEAHFDKPSSAQDDPVGRVVGSYRIVRLLGAGGMGQVYLGTRTDGTFDRDVAIKIMHPGPNDAGGDLMARFDEECRILASLRHPSIATLFDAGRLPDGRLFIVMEYVDGVPITTYCNKHDLSNRDRLRLFEGVCAAVAAAHRHLIVHRDLKPANVLVDATGKPKLLDFGIAKVLTPAGLEVGFPTEPGLKRATPAYASPEQLSGAPANTGMDVFALGVILHEVLTETRPKRVSSEATTNSHAYEEPSHCQKGVEPSRALDGELDAIVLKALDTPDRRYRSVDALAADLRAHATNYPVVAFSGSPIYPLQKYLRRNRGLALLALVAVIASAATAASLVRSLRAERRERDALVERLAAARVLTESLFQVDQSLAVTTGATMARERLVRSISDYLDRLKERAGADRGLRQDIAANYRRIGDIQGNPNGPNLGDRARALASYAAATDLLRELVRERAEPGIQFELALTRAGAGDVLAADKPPAAAEPAYREAQALAEQLTRDHQGDPRYEALLAGVHRSSGDLALLQQDNDAALARYQKALDIEQAIVSRFGDSAERQHFRAVTHLRLADAQVGRNRLEEARHEYEEGVQMLRGMSQSGNKSVDLSRDTALALNRLAQLTRVSDPKAALDTSIQALDILRELAQADPQDARSHRDLADALVRYGDMLGAQDEQRARSAYSEARQIIESLNRNVPSDPQSSDLIAAVNSRLAEAPVPGAPEFVLSAVIDGRRVPIPANTQLPDNASEVALVPAARPGWSQYVIMFGATGDATLLDETQGIRGGWLLPIAGPAPAQTYLLLAVPQALSDPQRRQLAMDIGAIAGPRVVEWGELAIWNSETGDRVLSRFKSRGGSSEWMSDVRARLERVRELKFSGRTFPIRASR